MIFSLRSLKSIYDNITKRCWTHFYTDLRTVLFSEISRWPQGHFRHVVFFSLIFDNGAICYWLVNLRFSITNTWRLHLKLSTMTFNVMLECLWTWFILLFLAGELLSVLVECHSESKKRCPGNRSSAVQSDFWNCHSISTPENISCPLYMKYRN